MKKWLICFWSFFKIGLFTIGGGYTMLPIIENELVKKQKWTTHDEVLDSYALGQSIPGVIAVNTATLLGFKIGGVGLAIGSFLGVISPSIIIIAIISVFYAQATSYEIVEKGLEGVRIAVLALLCTTVYQLIRKSIKDWFGIILAMSAFGMLMFIKVSPIWVLIVGAIVSILYYQKRGQKNA